jgi:hypothetical protein
MLGQRVKGGIAEPVAVLVGLAVLNGMQDRVWRKIHVVGHANTGGVDIARPHNPQPEIIPGGFGKRQPFILHDVGFLQALVVMAILPSAASGGFGTNIGTAVLGD